MTDTFEDQLAHLWGNVPEDSRKSMNNYEAWRQIPERFADAVPTDPAVVAWLDQVIASAETAHEAERPGERNLPYPMLKGGPSLLLLGRVGVGKTHQAIGVYRRLLKLGLVHSGRITTSADMYASLRPRHMVDSEEVFREYAFCGLLVIDDVGASKVSEFTEEVTYRVINARYERVYPTIVTSNALPADLPGLVGQRVASRLVEMCSRVSLKGPDRRVSG